ncbi:MAG: DNA-binding protein [Methanobacteriota archaeon]
MSELDELRAKRMQELMQSQGAQDPQQQIQHQMQQQEVERQIHQIISQVLSPEARERLGNIRAARPEHARQIEVLLIQLAQSGRLPAKISDDQFKEILGKLKGQQRDTKISRR